MQCNQSVSFLWDNKQRHHNEATSEDVFCRGPGSNRFGFRICLVLWTSGLKHIILNFWIWTCYCASFRLKILKPSAPMLRCHSVPDCSSPSSHRRGHPCRKTFGSFACFPSLNLLMQKHIMNSGQKFCLVVIFRSPSSLNLWEGFLLRTLHCMVCTSMPLKKIDMAEPCLCMVSTMCCHKPQKPTQQQNQLYEKFGYWVEEFTSRSPPNGNVYTPHESENISPGITGWLEPMFQFGVRWIHLLLNGGIQK